MFGIQGGREGKMGVKTFILQRVQWVQLPPCLRGENYASRFLTFSATSGGIRAASPEAAPFLNSKVWQTFFIYEPVHRFRWLHKWPSSRSFLTNPHFNDGLIPSRLYQIKPGSVRRDGGERRGPDPWLYQASLTRGDTQLRFRGLEKGRRGVKGQERLSRIGFRDRCHWTFVYSSLVYWLAALGRAWMISWGSRADRTQDDDFLEIPSDRVQPSKKKKTPFQKGLQNVHVWDLDKSLFS